MGVKHHWMILRGLIFLKAKNSGPILFHILARGGRMRMDPAIRENGVIQGDG